METPAVARLKSLSELFSLGFKHWRERNKNFLLLAAATGVLAALGLMADILAFIGAIALVLVYIGVLVVATNAPLSWNQLWPHIRRVFWPLVSVAILGSVVMLGGYLLLIIPGIILSIYLGFSLFAVLIDGQRGMSALRKSHAIVNGRWWPVFGRMLVLGIVAGIISEIANRIGATGAVGLILNSIIGILVVSWSYSVTTVLYEDLKATQPANAPAPTGFLANYKVLIVLGLISALIIPFLFMTFLVSIFNTVSAY